jgi:hypothetical protein
LLHPTPPAAARAPFAESVCALQSQARLLTLDEEEQEEQEEQEEEEEESLWRRRRRRRRRNRNRRRLGGGGRGGLLTIDMGLARGRSGS